MIVNRESGSMMATTRPCTSASGTGPMMRLSSDRGRLSPSTYTVPSGTISEPTSVVSVPMMIDAGADARTAMATSLRVTLRDPPAMITWAALIVVLVAVGFASLLIGMIVVFPLLSHATWHAYRDLVE